MKSNGVRQLLVLIQGCIHIYLIKSKSHPNSRIDASLQICDANLVDPFATSHRGVATDVTDIYCSLVGRITKTA